MFVGRVILFLFLGDLVDAGLLRGVLAREAFRLFMPRCLEGVEEAGDLAWEFARMQLRGDEEKLWVSTWFKVSPMVSVRNIVYHAPFGFPIFEKLSDGRFLGEVFKIFYQLDVYRYDLSFKESPTKNLDTLLVSSCKPIHRTEQK